MEAWCVRDLVGKYLGRVSEGEGETRWREERKRLSVVLFLLVTWWIFVD